MAIFGSVARGEARPDSDVDIVVEFRGRPSFDKYMDLKFFLEDLLASPIDLVTPAAIRPAMRERVKSEAVYVA